MFNLLKRSRNADVGAPAEYVEVHSTAPSPVLPNCVARPLYEPRPDLAQMEREIEANRNVGLDEYHPVLGRDFIEQQRRWNKQHADAVIAAGTETTARKLAKDVLDASDYPVLSKAEGTQLREKAAREQARREAVKNQVNQIPELRRNVGAGKMMVGFQDTFTHDEMLDAADLVLLQPRAA